MRGHFPAATAEAERLGDERADRAQIHHVAGKLVIDGLLDGDAHLHLLAAPDHAELLEAFDLFREAHAARAVDATGHVRGDERPEILIGHRALALGETGNVATESDR